MTPEERVRLFDRMVVEFIPLLGPPSQVAGPLQSQFRFLEEAMSFNIGDFDEHQLRSMLMALRQFFAKMDRVNIQEICDLCVTSLTDARLRKRAEDCREIFRVQSECHAMKLYVEGAFGGKEITPEGAYDLFMNGWYFHPDREKRGTLQSMGESARTAARWQFLTYVIAAISYVLNLGQVVRLALRGGRFDFSTELGGTGPDSGAPSKDPG